MAIPCIPAFIVAAGFFNETLKTSRVAICVLDNCSVTIQYNQSSSSLTPQVVKDSSVLFCKTCSVQQRNLQQNICDSPITNAFKMCLSQSVFHVQYSVKTTEHDNLFSCHI